MPRRLMRPRQRGAAIVEAAVVMPVLVSFLGMMVWFHSLFQEKQVAMLKARTEMLTYASHNCDGKEPPSDNPSLGGDSSGAASAGGLGSAMSTIFNVEHKTASGTGKGKYRVASSWSQNVSHTSSCMCNEKYRDGSLTQLVDFGVGIVTKRSIF